jgi:molecular chaperone GrpE (heat shock protein)
MLNTKNLKFIDSYEKLKEGYLYYVTDALEDCYEIGVMKKFDETQDEFIEFVMLISSTPNSVDAFTKQQISPVPETDKNFDQSINYAFYEISPQEEHPEYLL